jgi:hypothetical protein
MPSTGPLLTIQARIRPIFTGAAVVAAIAMKFLLGRSTVRHAAGLIRRTVAYCR